MAQAPTTATTTLDPATTTPTTKPWQQSLTVKGAALAAVAPLILANGPGLLHLVGVDAASALELTNAAAQLIGGLGAIMAFIGRMRLGGLH